MRLIKSKWTIENSEFYLSTVENKLYFFSNSNGYCFTLNKDFYTFNNFLEIKPFFLKLKDPFFMESKNPVISALLNSNKKFFFLRYISHNFFLFKQFCKKFFLASAATTVQTKGNNLKFYFNEIKLFGLGFRVKKITGKIHRLYLGFSNFIYIFSTENIIIKYSQILKRLFIFSNSKQEIKNFLAIFFLLKPLSPYRLYGSTTPNKLIFLKTGKKR